MLMTMPVDPTTSCLVEPCIRCCMTPVLATSIAYGEPAIQSYRGIAIVCDHVITRVPINRSLSTLLIHLFFLSHFKQAHLLFIRAICWHPWSEWPDKEHTRWVFFFDGRRGQRNMSGIVLEIETDSSRRKRYLCSTPVNPMLLRKSLSHHQSPKSNMI